jgi:glycosyltransferase involved in cell wall biosynthesis
MRIGWFTPFPPDSALGDYTEAVVAGLAAAGVTVVRLAPDLTPTFLEGLGGFDLLVFNVGGSWPECRAICEVAALRPGLVILHDLRAIDSAASALRRCLGVIVHSRRALERVRETVPAPVEKIDPPLSRLAVLAPAPARPPGERIRLLTVGPITRDGMIAAALRAIRQSDFLRNRVTYRLVGEMPDESHAESLRTLIQVYGLGETVELAGPCPEGEQPLLGADIIIGPGNPVTGDESGPLLGSLAAGLATVVWDRGFGAELPDDVVVKVSAAEELGPLLERLVRDPERRRRLGDRARAHVRERFDVGRYCDRFRAFAEKILRDRPLLELADHVADLLLEVGAQPTDGLAGRLADELSLFDPPQEVGEPAGASHSEITRPRR